MRVKNARASIALRQALDPSQYWLTSLRWQNLGKMFGPPPTRSWIRYWRRIRHEIVPGQDNNCCRQMQQLMYGLFQNISQHLRLEQPLRISIFFRSEYEIYQRGVWHCMKLILFWNCMFWSTSESTQHSLDARYLVHYSGFIWDKPDAL